MNYLVIDLEMCKVPHHYRSRNYKYATEIIEIGAVLLDDQFEKIGTVRQYVHPEHGVIDTYIADLTGIANRQVKHAQKLEASLLQLSDWIGDREYKVYAWSDSDRCQLVHEIACKGLEDERIDSFMEEDRWVDYQAVFGERYGFDHAISLKEALELCDMEPDGHLHDGLDDAVNTANMIAKLERDPDFRLISQTTESVSQPVNTCMGDLFSKLNINFG